MIQTRGSSDGGVTQRAHTSLLHGNKDAALSIGIINNMSGAGLYATTRQFCDLLSDAAQGLDIRVKTVSPFAHSYSETADGAVLRQRKTMDALSASRIDGLIVTGAEPRASKLVDEPCLPFLAKLVEWSENNVLSTIWSCLATQAAVYHLDGIERRQLGRKLSGIFECARFEHTQYLKAIRRNG
jgi:homoserine O-succinyltransferase/O-acetyltransferase